MAAADLPAGGAGPAAAAVEPPPLPETAALPWRRRVDAAHLRTQGRLWTATTVAHVVPFCGTAGLLVALEPLAFPASLAALAHAWVIPELYARRGANVVRPRPRRGETEERTALGLLGDLVGHEARDLHRETGLVLERGRLGVWLVAEAGAVLLTQRGRRAACFCVQVPDERLPSADRTAHLLLALRADEQGFATVANLAFSGARWRVRRRMPKAMRPALDRAAAVARRA